MLRVERVAHAGKAASKAKEPKNCAVYLGCIAAEAKEPKNYKACSDWSPSIDKHYSLDWDLTDSVPRGTMDLAP